MVLFALYILIFRLVSCSSYFLVSVSFTKKSLGFPSKSVPLAGTEMLHVKPHALTVSPVWASGPMSILWTKKVERLCCFF